MAMTNIFPESMKALDPDNVKESFKTLEEFISYMKERIDFWSKQSTLKFVSTSGGVVEGSLNVSGSIILENHSSPIGKIVVGSCHGSTYTSKTSGWRSIGKISLPAGTWILFANAVFVGSNITAGLSISTSGSFNYEAMEARVTSISTGEGFNVSRVWQSSQDSTLNMSVYVGTTSSVPVNGLRFYAARIA